MPWVCAARSRSPLLPNTMPGNRGRYDTDVTDLRAAARLTLDLVPGSYAICRLEPGDSLPPWVMQGAFFSVTRTPAELSAVCDVAGVPSGVKAEGPWSALAVRGPLDLDMTGVLAGLATPLAAAGISIFAVSTYDTDYILVRSHELDRAVHVLWEAGHNISKEGGASPAEPRTQNRNRT
jgi:hypothetical protein